MRIATAPRASRRQRSSVHAAHGREGRLARPDAAGPHGDRDLSPGGPRRARADRLHAVAAGRAGLAGARSGLRDAAGLPDAASTSSATTPTSICRSTGWSGRRPGLVVLHDLAFDDFVRGLQTSGDRLGFVAIREALEARELVTLPDARANPPLRIPWVAAAARRARGIVVHAEFCRRYLEQIGCRTPIFVIPHPPVESAAAIAGAAPTGARLRAAAEARGARTLVVAAGDVNEAKQLEGLLGRRRDPARGRARGRRRPDASRRTTSRRWRPPPGSAAGCTSRRTSATSNSSDGCTRPTSSRTSDIRTAGEVSGSLARAMQVGRPTLVSATGTYLDSPPGTVVTVAPGAPDAAELAARIAELAADRDLRERIGATARRHMEAHVAERGDRARLRRRHPSDDRPGR